MPDKGQKEAVKFCLSRGGAGLLLDPGFGKTSITYAVTKMLKKDMQLKGVLVVAPLRPARLVWRQEQQKWSDFKDLSVRLLRGTEAQMRAMLEENHDVYVTNYEYLDKFFFRTKKDKNGNPGKVWRHGLTALGKKLMERVNVLVWDELSKMKHPDTARFKLIKPHLYRFARKYGLTGSVAANGLMNLFGECYVLDEGRTLGPFITYYRTQYFNSVGQSGFVFEPKPGAEEAIYERVAPLMLRLDDAHLGLAPLREINVRFELPEALRAKYDELENDFFTEIKRQILTAPNKLSVNNLCRQFCSGAVYKSQVNMLTGLRIAGPREYGEIHNEKLDAMEELLEELQSQQVLIGYEFQHDKERILHRLGAKRVGVFGKSEKEDARVEAAWNAGDLQWAMGHPAGIAHGLNLQGSNANNLLWFTMTWDFELYDQFNRRLRRRGSQATSFKAYRLIGVDTVEESVAAMLGRKDRTQRKFYQALLDRVRIDR